MCVCKRVFSVGPGLDSMSPARSRRSASHAAGTHGWLAKKTGWPGLRRGGIDGYNLHSHNAQLLLGTRKMILHKIATHVYVY